MSFTLPDVPTLDNPALYNFLSAVKRRLSLDTETTGFVVVAGDTSSGDSDQASLVLDYGGVGDGSTSNNSAFTAAEADPRVSVRIPDGVYVTSLAKSALTKRYFGDGLILAGTDGLPARFGYMASKPSTWPVQGQPGFWRGDQRFTDGGEWKIIGPTVRTYDLSARYFESNTIPHARWLDVESGSSGVAAYLPVGAAAGTSTVTINGAAQAEWVGKQVALCREFGGAQVETKTIQSVAGSTVTFTTPLANTYTWNPAAGFSPCLSFAPRTWGGMDYTRVRHRGAGDGYGNIVRMQVEYVPTAPQLAHTFLAATGGQYGGDVNFIAGSTGTYATGWESSYTDQNNDVAVIAQVDSFLRSNDHAAGGGRVWLGTYFKSEGARAADVAHAVAGRWRAGLDTSLAILMDSTSLVASAAAGATSISVKSANGAQVGDPINVINGATIYVGTITSIVGATIQITPGLSAAFPVDSYVDFPEGGAIVNAALGQKMIWNSTGANSARGADPLGVFGPPYGNVQGDIESGSDTDGSGRFWYTKFNGRGPDGATARIRLRPTSFQVNVDIQGGATINSARELVSNGLTGVGNISGALILGAGLGHQIRFNLTTNKFDFLIAGAVVLSLP